MLLMARDVERHPGMPRHRSGQPRLVGIGDALGRSRTHHRLRLLVVILRAKRSQAEFLLAKRQHLILSCASGSRNQGSKPPAGALRRIVGCVARRSLRTDKFYLQDVPLPRIYGSALCVSPCPLVAQLFHGTCVLSLLQQAIPDLASSDKFCRHPTVTRFVLIKS